MAKTWKSIHKALRDCILSCGKSYSQIARETGISRPALYRLLAGGGLSLKHTETLMRYFRLVIVSEAFDELKQERG